MGRSAAAERQCAHYVSRYGQRDGWRPEGVRLLDKAGGHREAEVVHVNRMVKHWQAYNVSTPRSGLSQEKRWMCMGKLTRRTGRRRRSRQRGGGGLLSIG